MQGWFLRWRKPNDTFSIAELFDSFITFCRNLFFVELARKELSQFCLRCTSCMLVACLLVARLYQELWLGYIGSQEERGLDNCEERRGNGCCKWGTSTWIKVL